MRENNNTLPKLILLYAGLISIFSLVFATVTTDEKIADKAVNIFGNLSLSAITGVLGYLTAKVSDSNNNIVTEEEYQMLLEDYDRLKKELDRKV